MKRLSSRRMTASADETTVNPMDGLGNLADAMLVLAVGIMLALILNWKVDITAVGTQSSEQAEQTEQIDQTEQQIAIDENDLSDSEEQIDESDMQRIGELYYDEETGTYYAIMGD